MECAWLLGLRIEVNAIQDRGVIGVDGFDFRPKRLGRFWAFGQGDPVADADTQFVPQDHRIIFGLRPARQVVQRQQSSRRDQLPLSPRCKKYGLAVG